MASLCTVQQAQHILQRVLAVHIIDHVVQRYMLSIETGTQSYINLRSMLQKVANRATSGNVVELLKLFKQMAIVLAQVCTCFCCGRAQVSNVFLLPFVLCVRTGSWLHAMTVGKGICMAPRMCEVSSCAPHVQGLPIIERTYPTHWLVLEHPCSNADEPDLDPSLGTYEAWSTVQYSVFCAARAHVTLAAECNNGDAPLPTFAPSPALQQQCAKIGAQLISSKKAELQKSDPFLRLADRRNKVLTHHMARAVF